MRISHVKIENFRNFQQLDLELSDQAVVIGENKVGKSNLLYTLRLVLDPSLPDTARQLRDEDFWDGLERPLKKADMILISVELAEFSDDDNLLAVLGEHLCQAEPMTARLTYTFQPLPTLEGEPTSEADYEFFIFGGDRPENRVGYDVRRRLPLDMLPALRDAEADLLSWRRSPLRPLLDFAASQINRAELNEMADYIYKATQEVARVPEIEALANEITQRLTEIVGSHHGLEMILGFSPSDSERLIRALRLFIDGGRRAIGDASLGSANLIYLTLKSLELEQLVSQNRRDHTFLAIEEPEAHLHPHLQRLVFREFLRPRSHREQLGHSEKTKQNVLLTTHSPNIVSVAPIQTLVVLRKSASKNTTEGFSTANLHFDEDDVADLERYLDVTRGEILFANGVLLVEGNAEEYLVPVLSKLAGIDIDELGISVCSISGTNFAPYVKLLGHNGLNTPFALITDLDPQEDGNLLGVNRVIKLLPEVMSEADLNGKETEQLLELAEQKGFFLNDHTLEVDLFTCGNHMDINQTLIELAPSETAKERAKTWMEKPDALDIKQFLSDIKTIGKGRFAQRLASRIGGGICPIYMEKAIKYVVNLCS